MVFVRLVLTGKPRGCQRTIERPAGLAEKQETPILLPHDMLFTPRGPVRKYAGHDAL